MKDLKPGSVSFVALIIAIYIFSLTCTSSESRTLEIPDGMFIEKSYIGLSPENASNHQCVMNEENFKLYCSYYYRDESRARGFNVFIIEYINFDKAIQEMYTAYSLSKGKPQFGHGMKSAYTNYKDGGIGSIKWISGERKIFMTGDRSSIPQEAIDDYMAKYPPTHTFKPEEMDPRKMMKKHLLSRYDTIMRIEKERVKTNDKEQTYRAIIAQCGIEMPIRCQMGLVNQQRNVDCPESFCFRRDSHRQPQTTDCPAAMEMDHNERAEMWKNLKKDINAKDVVFENVQPNFDYHMCDQLFDQDQIAFQALLLLNVEESELMTFPGNILPSMDNKMRRAYFDEIKKRKEKHK